MVTDQQKAFCVLEYQSTQSIITVQRAFRRQYRGDPPTHQSILRWYRQLKDKGCLCKGKSSGRPGVSAEKVERIREAFARSPQKSTRRASRELDIPHATVWKILRKRLRQKAYRIQLLQHLRPNDLVIRNEFCYRFQAALEDDEFASRLVFSDEAKFSPEWEGESSQFPNMGHRKSSCYSGN